MSEFWNKVGDSIREFDGIMENISGAIDDIDGLGGIGNNYLSALDDHKARMKAYVIKTILRCAAVIVITVLVCIFA